MKHPANIKVVQRTAPSQLFLSQAGVLRQEGRRVGKNIQFKGFSPSNDIMPTPLALPTLARGSNLCCLTKCCPCVNLSFLKTTEGILKMLEVILGSVCQNLLIGYGITYILTIGSSFYSFLTACSACMMTSFVLLICYVISPSTVHVLRSSIFESLFNAFGSILYLSSSCFLAVATYTYLYPVYKITSLFEVYPAMSGAYITGFILSAIHAYDAYLAYNT